MTDQVERAGWKEIRKFWTDDPDINTMKRRLKRMGIKLKRYYPAVNIHLFNEISRQQNFGTAE